MPLLFPCPYLSGGHGGVMFAALKFEYDRIGDILYVSQCPSCAEQVSEAPDDDIVVHLNPSTNEVEIVEVLFFSTRLPRGELFELPIATEMRLTV